MLCYRQRCPSASQQCDSGQTSPVDAVFVEKESENARQAETAAPLVDRPTTSGTDIVSKCTAAECRTHSHHTSCLSSTDSAECLDSIFDYHSTHPSVNLDDICDSVDETSFGDGRVAESMDLENSRNCCKDQGHTKTDVTAATNNNVSDNCASTSLSRTSKPEHPQSSLHQPSIISSSQTRSRLPAPGSRAAAKAVSGSRDFGKSHLTPANGFCNARM